MIEDTLKKFNGRFKKQIMTTYNSQTFFPTYTLIDTFDNESFLIQIDSFAADPEIVIENVLNEKIIYKRDSKINAIINEKKL
jgi:hypothetical protein